MSLVYRFDAVRAKWLFEHITYIKFSPLKNPAISWTKMVVFCWKRELWKMSLHFLRPCQFLKFVCLGTQLKNILGGTQKNCENFMWKCGARMFWSTFFPKYKTNTVQKGASLTCMRSPSVWYHSKSLENVLNSFFCKYEQCCELHIHFLFKNCSR